MSAESVVGAGEFMVDVACMGEVRAILREADPSAWRPERAEELRGRALAAIASLRAWVATPSRADALADALDDAAPPAKARALAAVMEEALPEDATRARWSAFVGAVHPEYEALLAALPSDAPGAHSVRPTNYARSLFHCGAATVALVTVALVPSHAVILGIAFAFAGYAWSMEIVRRASPRLNALIMRLYARVAHPHEWYRVNSATWYATALVFLALFTTRHATMASLAVLGVADPVAAFVGRRWGKHVLRAGRSLEGTLAFVVSGTAVAALALVLASGLSPSRVLLLAALAGVVGALAELVTTRLDDNLTIPVAVGGAVTAAAALLG